MKREQFDRAHQAPLFPQHILQTSEEIRREINQSCGRFKSAPSTEAQLRSFIASTMAHVDILPQPSLHFRSGIPPNWQRIITFLHEQDVLESPAIFPRAYRNDRPYMYNLELAPRKKEGLSDGRVATFSGFGGSLQVEEALSKAIGEILERYFLSIYKRDALYPMSYAQLLKKKMNVINLRKFDFFLEWQKKAFPILSYDDDTVFQWVTGEEFGSGSRVYLPAQLVYWTYRHTTPEYREKMIFRQTTSGSAGHFTRDEAVLSALLELIQREAFLIHWLNNISPPVIDIDSIDDTEIRDFITYIKRFDLEVTFLDTTSDLGIPTATCVIIDYHDEGAPIISIGSSTGFDLKNTIMQSAIEATIINNYASLQETHKLPEDYKPFRDPNLGRDQRLRAWRGPKMAERFRFFISGERKSAQEFLRNMTSFKSPNEQLTYLTDLFKKLGEGYEIYIYEVKNSVLDALGYHVVRTIVPRLVPLYLEEFAAPLGAQRLREVPGRIGHKTAEEFNPWPHPFP